MVFLTGFMASGKTTVGRRLADRLDVPFVDLDSRIESRAGRPVSEIFETEGEEGFRRQESQALEEVLGEKEGVVATGGGLPGNPSNVRRMRSHGPVVWLDVPFETLVRRLEGDPTGRPLFENREQARRLYQGRLPSYRDADLRVEVSPDEGVENVVSRILLFLDTSASC